MVKSGQSHCEITVRLRQQASRLAPVPVFYECQRCAACCRWPGQVRLVDGEVARLASFLKLSEHEFIQRFTRLALDRRGLALMEQAGGACIFLDGAGCAVQSVKPQQCRDFPNLWNDPGWQQHCQAIPHELSDADYQQRLSTATGRPPQ